MVCIVPPYRAAWQSIDATTAAIDGRCVQNDQLLSRGGSRNRRHSLINCTTATQSLAVWTHRCTASPPVLQMHAEHDGRLLELGQHLHERVVDAAELGVDLEHEVRRVPVPRRRHCLKRLLDESPWLQFTSECQRFGLPPRLNKSPFWTGSVSLSV
jgi:hypothetical protein